MQGQEEIQEGLTIEMGILINAWARYRPDPNKKREVEESEKDLEEIFTKDFMNYFMA